VALEPIVIQRSIFSAPPSQQAPIKDVDYYSNDILRKDITCNDGVTISETFKPQCITKKKDAGDKDVCLTYKAYPVNEIHGKVSFGVNNYLNTWYRDTYNHFASRSKDLSEYGFARSMLTFDLNSIYGANNASSRSTPSSLLTCLKGQRLFQAIKSLENKDNLSYQSTSNEAVVWTDGKSYIEQQTRPDLLPVRLVDIAVAMADLPFLDPNTCKPDPEQRTVFYDPSVACTANSKPTKIPDIPASFQRVRIPPEQACHYLQTAVQVGDIGSNVRLIRMVDSNGPQLKYSSIPLGNLSTNKDIPLVLIPSGQAIPPIDICAATPQVESEDKPNSVTFDLVIREFFGMVYDTPVTFKRTLTRSYKLDSRIPGTFAAYKVALNNFLPAETQLEFNTQDFVASANDKKKTLDPGNGILEKVFKNLVWPANSL
jgi:hypothetical protein